MNIENPYARHGKYKVENAYLCGKWMRAALLGITQDRAYCEDRGMMFQKASATAPNTIGGFLVPDQLLEEIMILRETYGVVRQQARTWPMKLSGTASVPRRTAGFSANWTAEGSAITQSAPAYDNVGLNAKKLAVLTLLSTELEEDSISAWGAFIVGELAWALAKGEDDAAFQGDGTSTYGRIEGLEFRFTDGSHNAGKYTAANGHNTFGTLDNVDIAGLIALLPKRALPNAKIYVSLTGYGNTFVRLAATAGGLVASVDANGTLQANYSGFPIVITQSLPAITTTLSGKLMLAVGDLRQAVALGERHGLTIQRLNERFADSDQIGVKATERVDIVCGDLGDNTNPGAVVGLVAP